ncbi:MAG TPA: acyloxyacyl hydrolase [Saprospiraceae bacterium]|nr:acyloxyacyl hydrolase [Saprospiraceae bacterium]HPI04937.1 acyloxyacyl hydrolase [Saprospiraceae bacterium]
MNKRFLPALLVCLTLGAAYAQRPWQVETALAQGDFYSHSDFRAPMIRPIRSMDFCISRPTDGTRRWQQLHHYPDMGLRFRVRDMGNTAVYGQVFSLVPYLRFYPWKKEKWGVQVSHGTGLCYISKIFSEKKNPSNRLISSHLNAASFLSAGIYYQPARQWNVAATLEFSHESNGNFKIGNRGFNIWAAGLAVRRTWGGPVKRIPPTVFDTPFKRWLFSVEISGGLHDYHAYNGELLVTPEATVAVLRQHNERFRSYAGLGYCAFPFPLTDRAAFVIIGEEVLLGNLSVRYSLGTYLTDTGSRLRPIEKVGISYYPFKSRTTGSAPAIARGMYFGTYLKAHGSVAAHIEFTVGNVF